MKMVVHICRSIISPYFKKTHFHPHKSHYSVAFCCLFFSSNRQKQLKISSPVLDYLLNKRNFSYETSVKAASVLPHLKPEKIDAMISFFEENGFSQTHLEKIVKCRPRLLYAKLEKTIMPKFKFFQDFGFPCTDIADIMSGNPHILCKSLSGVLEPTLSKLEKLFGSVVQVSNFLKRRASVLCHLKNLWHNIELLQSFGISKSDMVRYMSSCTHVFLINPERMKNFVKRIDEMGFDRDSRMFFYAICTLSKMSDETWKLKLDFFRTMGISENDVLAMFRKTPLVIAISEKKISKMLELLISTGKYDVSNVVKRPEVLLYSVEGRLKPRLEVLRILESKNLLRKFPSLGTIRGVSNEKFEKVFVSPYLSEVGDVYTHKRATMDKTVSTVSEANI